MKLSFHFFGSDALTLLHLYQAVALADVESHVFLGDAVLPPLEVLHEGLPDLGTCDGPFATTT